MTPEQLKRVEELRLLDEITLAVRLMKAEEQLRASSEKLQDTARIDFLAEITNLSALRDCGHMLPGEKVRKIEKTAEILSERYEIHRRTSDTPQAFRAAVDEAIKETGHG